MVRSNSKNIFSGQCVHKSNKSPAGSDDFFCCGVVYFLNCAWYNKKTWIYTRDRRQKPPARLNNSSGPSRGIQAERDRMYSSVDSPKEAEGAFWLRRGRAGPNRSIRLVAVSEHTAPVDRASQTAQLPGRGSIER